MGRANRVFHRLILTPCAMPQLLKSIDDLNTASARFLFSGWRADWDAPIDRDRAILDALRAAHVDAAASVLAARILSDYCRNSS